MKEKGGYMIKKIIVLIIVLLMVVSVSTTSQSPAHADLCDMNDPDPQVPVACP